MGHGGGRREEEAHLTCTDTHLIQWGMGGGGGHTSHLTCTDTMFSVGE